MMAFGDCSGILKRGFEISVAGLLSLLWTLCISAKESERRAFQLTLLEDLSHEFQSSLAEVDTKELFKEFFIKNGLENFCNFVSLLLWGLPEEFLSDT
jgi:hypothetical protein